jgi:hypothetical protein
MKRIILLSTLIYFTVLSHSIKAQTPINSYTDASNTDCSFPLVDGYTYDRVRSIGIGAFLPNPNPSGTRARLHVRNDALACKFGAFDGKLFRTDGNKNTNNTWQMFTGAGNVASGYNEVFRLDVPASTSDFVLQSSQATGNIKFNTGGANFRAIITSAGAVGVNTLTPGNRVEIASTATDPTPSGLRFSNLTSSSSTVSNPGPGVLAVNNAGDVIYVPAPTGSGTVCAQNGLNCTVASPLIEMGGNLLHGTNVTMHDPLGTAHDMVFNGIGQFGIGNNLTAGFLANPKILFSNFHNGTNNVWNTALEVDFTSSGNITGQGVGILSDVKVTGFGVLPVSGITSNVLSNAQQIFGFNSSVSPAASGGANDAYGINAGAANAGHNWGGSFNATSTLTAAFTSAVGVEANGVGSDLAYGALVSAKGSSNLNVGIQSAADAPIPATACYGMISYANSSNSAFNIGATGLASGNSNSYGLMGAVGSPISFQSFMGGSQIGVLGYDLLGNYTGGPTPVGNSHIGTAGVIGGLLGGPYGPAFANPTATIGVYGLNPDTTTANNYAGLFNGHVNVNGRLTVFGVNVVVSDQSVKKNIKPIKTALDVLGKLAPKTYNLTNENCKQLFLAGTKTQFGLIAQEVEKVIPEIVYEVNVPGSTDKNGNVVNEAKKLKGISYDQLISLLIKGTQEQQEQIANQQKQIDELKALVQSSSNGTDNKTSNTQAVTLSDNNAIVLNQNVPNPFAESTTITYNIPSDFNKAQLIFSTNEGKIIKVADIKQKGEGTLNVFANDLSSGLYSYSLVVDGKTIDTKKMVKN